MFLGGRQRVDGQQGTARISLDDQGRFQVTDEYEHNLSLVLNTEARKEAWKLLPDWPESFSYTKAKELVNSVMKSSSTFNYWMRECRRLKVIVDTTDGKLMKETPKPSTQATQ